MKIDVKIELLEAHVDELDRQLNRLYRKKYGAPKIKRCGFVTRDGERFWLPQCMGGAVYGREGCTCIC